MDKELELFLETVEKYLKRMPISERIDIVNELKSYINELQSKGGLSTKEILEKLGPPKELAAGYLGEKISSSGSFSFKKMLLMISFYGLVSLSGVFIVPCGTVLAGGLMLSGVLAVIAGLIKFVGFLAGFDVPFVVFNFGGFTLHPLLVLPASIILGALFYFLGRALWKAVIRYIKKVSVIKRDIGA